MLISICTLDACVFHLNTKCDASRSVVFFFLFPWIDTRILHRRSDRIRCSYVHCAPTAMTSSQCMNGTRSESVPNRWKSKQCWFHRVLSSNLHCYNDNRRKNQPHSPTFFVQRALQEFFGRAKNWTNTCAASHHCLPTNGARFCCCSIVVRVAIPQWISFGILQAIVYELRFGSRMQTVSFHFE